MDHNPARFTHCIIFSLSNGLTTVREAAPAHPPANGTVQYLNTAITRVHTYKVGYYFRGKIGRKQSRQVKCLSSDQWLVIAVCAAGSSG